MPIDPAQPVGRPPALLLHEHLLQRRAAQAADLDRHVRRVEAELDGPGLVRGRHAVGQVPAGQLGLDLERDHLVDERRGRGPAGRGPRAVRPYMGAPAGAGASDVLTDCSVYASVGGVNSAPATAQTPSWWAAARSAPGPRGSSRRSGLDRVVLRRGRHAGPGRQLAGGRHGARAGRHGDGRAARACSAATSTPGRRPSSASTPASSPQGYSHAVLHRGRGGRRPTRGSRCSRPAGWT